MELEDDEYVNTSSEIGKLIVKLSRLEKRPCLDNSLGEILESFLQSLIKSEDFLNNGIFKINFAEAALLLQSSSLVYSKKVDLLWNMVNDCQKRMVSLKIKENENELKRIEEREGKYKRKRKPIEEKLTKDINLHKQKSFSVNWEEINNLQNTVFKKDSDLYSEWYKKIVSKWNLHSTQRSNNNLAYKQVHFRGLENAILDKDQDNEFVVYTSKMESVVALEELLLSNRMTYSDFPFELYKKLYLTPEYLYENQLTYEELEEYSIEFEKYMGIYRDQQLAGDKLNEEFDRSSIIDKNSPQKLRRLSSTVVSGLDTSIFDNIHMKECRINVLRLSVDDLSRLSRLSVDEVKKYWSEEDFKAENSASIEELTELPLGYSSVDSDDEGYNGGNEKSPENTLKNQSKQKNSNKQGATSTSSIIFERINYKAVPAKITNKRRSENREKDDFPDKRKKLSKRALEKLVRVTVDLERFNSFFYENYRPEEGEGEVEMTEFRLNDPIDSSSRKGQEDESPTPELTDHPILCTQDSGYESNLQYNEDSLVNDTQSSDFEDITTSISELDQPPEQPFTQQSYASKDDETIKEKPLYQRVYEWKQHMMKKFKEMKSADFNIHKYGSSIMENFEKDKPRPFSDIVEGKSAAEVTRYFISALQLANTSNVEIQGVQSGKLSNETFELKLISKDRYYDRLKDYVAPSEQDYIKRLNCVHELKKRRADLEHCESSSSKRNKSK